MKIKNYFLFILFLSLCIFPLSKINAQNLKEKLSGKILLQVENNGEAWYVNPGNQEKYFLGKPNDAFRIMKKLGIGISNADLSRIAIGTNYSTGEDSDNDGLPDKLEKAIGTDIAKKDTDNDGYTDKEELVNNYYPLGEGKLKIDTEFSKEQKGKILLQIENNGEAWYVNPNDYKRYYLGNPSNAFALMRKLGLGIKNNDLEKIKTNSTQTVDNSDLENTETDSLTASTTNDLPSGYYNISEMEKKIFELINNEREAEGLSRLKWNDDVADVARRHSADLADENKEITNLNAVCDLPIIHHEGLNFGLYNFNRLKNSEIHYFSMSGENIALMSGIVFKNIANPSQVEIDSLQNCGDIRININKQFKSFLDETEEDEKSQYIEEKLEERKIIFDNMGTITMAENIYQEQEKLNNNIALGWMNSPPHKENIMTSEFNESGIGIAYVNGYVIATQSFIKRIDCGYKDAECCAEDGYYPYCYQPLQCTNNICISEPDTEL